MPEATCTKCGVAFSYERVRGGRKNCDGCSRRKDGRRYKERHPDRVAASQRRWRAANPDIARAATKDWEERNREHLRARNKERWADPVERAKKQEWYRQWAARNRAKLSARVVEWQKRNPEKVRERTRRRRARRAGAALVDFTAADWRELLAEYEHRCAYCGIDGPLERDHVIPLVRGGDHTKANIVPACRSCNAQKSTLTAEEFYGRVGRQSSQG